MIRAIYFPDTAAFERHKTPGSFLLEAHGSGAPGLFDFIYFCPCGCGREGKLLIGYDVFLGLKKETEVSDVLAVYDPWIPGLAPLAWND